MTEQRDTTQPEKPTNIRRFAWLWGASIVIALLGIPLTPSPIAPELSNLGLTWGTLILFEVACAIVIVASVFPFFWLAVWRRKNWARWTLFIAFVAPTPLLFLNLTPIDPESLPLLGVEFLSLLVEAAAFYFLFTGDARPWFRREPST
jgi:hypothetical protein